MLFVIHVCIYVPTLNKSYLLTYLLTNEMTRVIVEEMVVFEYEFLRVYMLNSIQTI